MNSEQSALLAVSGAKGKVINNIRHDGVSYVKGETIDADKEVVAQLIEAGAVADPSAPKEDVADTSDAESKVDKIVRDATEKATKIVEQANADADKVREQAGKDAESTAVTAREDADKVKTAAQTEADAIKADAQAKADKIVKDAEAAAKKVAESKTPEQSK